MKGKKQILDVDFIGGQGSLTAVEEKAISEYFQRKKMKTTPNATTKNASKSARKYVTI